MTYVAASQTIGKEELDAIAIILEESNVPKATINVLCQGYSASVDLSEALKQIEARAVYMQVKDRTYADTHWEYIRQTCRNALSTME